MQLMEQWEEWLEAKANVPLIQNESETALLLSVYVESDKSLTLQVGNPPVNVAVGSKLRTFFTLAPKSDIRVAPPPERAKIRIAVFA